MKKKSVTRAGAQTMVLGFVVIAVGIIIRTVNSVQLPNGSSMSFEEAHALCNSNAGLMAQAVQPSFATGCEGVVMTLFWGSFFIVIGTIVAFIGMVAFGKAKQKLDEEERARKEL